MRVLVVLSAVAAALAIAPSASTGGWATVGFEPLPDGTSAGGTWSPTIFVKQHGVEPLSGLTPIVDLYDDQTGAATRFIATEASEAGVYTADVVFPAEGDWRVVIHSGFGDSQVSYGPVAIGPPAGDGGSREPPAIGLGIVALALLGGALLLGARRLRRLTPASG